MAGEPGKRNDVRVRISRKHWVVESNLFGDHVSLAYIENLA